MWQAEISTDIHAAYFTSIGSASRSRDRWISRSNFDIQACSTNPECHGKTGDIFLFEEGL